MPIPALKSLADKAGKSLKDAERYYTDAKKQLGKSDDKLTDSDYKQIMGIVKKRLGLTTKPTETELFTPARAMIEIHLGASTEDRQVRVYVDPSGEYCFATLEDVAIDPDADPRVKVIHKLANDYNWPSTSDFPESIDGYEGSLNELAQRVLAPFTHAFEKVDPVGPRRPRRKSLAQKQGARKGGRTRSRRQYTERKLDEGAGGWLTEYYYRPKHPDEDDGVLER